VNVLLTLPILVPLLAATVLVALWGRTRPQKAVALATTVIMLVNAVVLLATVRTEGVLTEYVGGWAAPFGITLVADLFAAVMVLVASIIGVAVCGYSVASTSAEQGGYGHYPLMLTTLAAVCGAFLSGDVFNLYVWFELMLLSSFVLLTLRGGRAQLEGAIKYVTLNLLSSILFLSAVGLIYGSTGTLNMADLALRLDAIEDPATATLLGAPLLVAFGIKAAVFPFFFWLPASYHTPLPVISALFAGLLTKVGVYAIIRSLTLLFDQEWAVMGDAILIVAGLTMVTGVLGAVAQSDMRRILSFHIVSQIGYMLMGLGIAIALLGGTDAAEGTDAVLGAAGIALAGSVFYIVHHIIVKTNLFLISGAVLKVRGTSELSKLGGLVSTHPMMAILFLVSALSLAGLPIFSGFWAKLALVRAGLEGGQYLIVAVSLLVSLLTLFSMMKIWTQAFWKAVPDAATVAPSRGTIIAMSAPIAALAALSIAIGVGAAPVFDLATETAVQLLDSDAYIEAVLAPSESTGTLEAAR
jgi:multicomponent Na+:H+ antiporter subunit D